MAQPFCDESGVAFAARLAESSTPLWSYHSILRVTKLGCRNGEATWAEWSGHVECFGQGKSFELRRQASWLKVWPELTGGHAPISTRRQWFCKTIFDCLKTIANYAANQSAWPKK